MTFASNKFDNPLNIQAAWPWHNLTALQTLDAVRKGMGEQPDLLEKTLMREEIITSLAQYIAKKILKQPNRVIRPDEALISSGLIDSFSLVDLGVFVEDTFGVRIEDTELNADTFDTLEQLATLIETRR